MIASELQSGFSRFGEYLSDKKIGATSIVGSISQDILDCLLADPKALRSLLTTSAKSSQAEGEWLKTDEAAKRMGFSRPYVAALIDAGEFGAGSTKSAGGHRRVLASSVDKWIDDHGVITSKDDRQTLIRSFDRTEYLEEPALSAEEREQLLKRIAAGNAESVKHRPSKKAA
jgi:excisionase family DNA binding protein